MYLLLIQVFYVVENTAFNVYSVILNDNVFNLFLCFTEMKDKDALQTIRGGVKKFNTIGVANF